MTTVVLKPKPKAEKPRSKPFRGFSISDETDKKVDAIAHKYNLSRSAAICQIIEQVYAGEFPNGVA